MKKILLLLLTLALLGGIGAGMVALLSMPLPQAKAPSASQSASEKPEIGVMKPVETMADVLEELSYELTQNQDTVGWLKVPETNINNSVLQSFNNVYYLGLNERKQEDIYGAYFVDYECSVGTREQMSMNTIIYGHSDLKDNPDGQRFSQLYRFTDPDFAKRNPYIYFSTLDDYMVWQVFAVFYTKTELEYIYPEYSPEGLTDLVNQAKLKSIYNYPVNVSADDKILTLSTCSIKHGSSVEHRFVVMAKLLPADAQETRPVTLTQNPTPSAP